MIQGNDLTIGLYEIDGVTTTLQNFSNLMWCIINGVPNLL